MKPGVDFSKETVNKPWGEYTRYVINQKHAVKIIKVEKGQSTSLQSHKNRDEFWIVMDDGLKIELDGKVVFPRAGDKIAIPRGSMHRLSSVSDTARILEIPVGDFDEDDIIRYEDLYGRV